MKNRLLYKLFFISIFCLVFLIGCSLVPKKESTASPQEKNNQTQQKTIPVQSQAITPVSAPKSINKFDVAQLVEKIVPAIEESLNPMPVESTIITAEGIINWTNYYRKKNGLSALKKNEQLAHMAEVKLLDQYNNKYIGHGAGSGALADAEGYKYLLVGENIRYSMDNHNPPYTDKQSVEGWIGSPTHCLHLYGAAYTEIGVAVGLVYPEYRPGYDFINIVQELGLPSNFCQRPDPLLAAEVEIENKEFSSYLAYLDSLPLGEERNKLVLEYNSRVASPDNKVNRYNAQVYAFNNCLDKYEYQNSVRAKELCK